jgi:polar amino acid transport system substrate-binding protein
MKSIKLLLAAIFLLSTLSHANTVTIRADEWYPINGVPDAKKPGYMIELAQVILAKHGHTVEYRSMPWERSLKEVRRGSFDCVVGAYKEDAPDFIFPDVAWGSIESSFYVKNETAWRYTGIDSVKKVVMGSIGGYAYSEELDKYIEQNKGKGKVQVINANNALEQNIKKLLKGRLDTVIESHLVMEAKLKSMGATDKVKSAGILVKAENMYIACSPAKSTSKEYAKLFSEGIKELRASGKLKEILDKYGLKDWQ